MPTFTKEDKELARQVLATLDGEKEPSEEKVQAEVTELQEAMQVVASLALPLIFSLRDDEGGALDPKRAHILGLAILLVEMAENCAPEGVEARTYINTVLDAAFPITGAANESLDRAATQQGAQG